MSAPAANALSLPVITIAPTPASASKSSSALPSSCMSCGLSAFSCLGRSSVMRPTRPFCSTLMSSGMSGMDFGHREIVSFSHVIDPCFAGRGRAHDYPQSPREAECVQSGNAPATSSEARPALPGQVNAFPLEPIEKAPLADLKKLQLERLRWTLQHAYDHVPHYRRKFDAAGVKPEDCRSLSDLAKFPFTTKADLRETYPFGMFALPMDRIVRIHASSGTTGKPTVVGYSAKDIDTWASVMARSIRAAGARPGDKVHVAYGYGLFTGGLGAHYGAERLGLAVIPLGGGMTERQVQPITDVRPEIIMVTLSYMLAIADEMERQGIDPAKCSLRLGIFGAEPWTNEMREIGRAHV